MMLIRKITSMIILGMFYLTVSSVSYANPSIPIVEPTYCFGENNLGQCVLYFGSASSCANINPCLNNGTLSYRRLTKAISDVVLKVDEKTFCYGINDTTKQCTLFYGSKKSCKNLRPCSLPFKTLP